MQIRVKETTDVLLINNAFDNVVTLDYPSETLVIHLGINKVKVQFKDGCWTVSHNGNVKAILDPNSYV